MLFIKNWDKASLDKSSNSIVAKYKNKINALTDKTDALRKLLGELYDEALILNERIKVDKQAIQKDLNDTADDLRETCGNSSWGQDKLKDAQDLLDRAEEDIEDIKTDVEITTGCLVVCQSGQGAGCDQQAPCDEASVSTPEEDCVVIVNGEFDCQGSDSYIDNCYGGCDGNQSCDSNTKVCPKCHGSEVDSTEVCWSCDTDQKETCGTADSQDGCEFNNDDGNCTLINNTGDCTESNNEGDCTRHNSTGKCQHSNSVGECVSSVTGNCGTDNDAIEVFEDDSCTIMNSKEDGCKNFNSEGTDCYENNQYGDCTINNKGGDCLRQNDEGSCQNNDKDSSCYTRNTGDEEHCVSNDNAKNCTVSNNNGDCASANLMGDCDTSNMQGNCNSYNSTGDCYESNDEGNCTADNVTGDCLSQSCEAGQECTECVTDQKESTTTEKCQAGANIGDEEYCDTCQGDESKVEEWDQEELEDLCSSIFEGGADACGTAFADCFNASECDGASFGAAAGCGTIQGCGACNESDSCSGGQECATGQTCYSNDCGEDCGQDCGQPCGQCGTCVSGEGPCNETCYPTFGCSGGQECRLGYNPGCEEGVVCPGGTFSPDCGQWGGEDI